MYYCRNVTLITVTVLGMAAMAGRAQDTRTVTEPKIPSTCQRLTASLSFTPDSNGGRLAEADESRLDTDRIQKAMDGCAPGHAVELAAGEGGKTAFLTGPLELREGVTLLIDKGVVLFGSRDPKVYEGGSPAGQAGLCGTSMPRPASFPTFSMVASARPRGGCRPLISVNGAKNTAIMGQGTIDGRGYARLLGRHYTWWELARKAQPKDDLYFSVRLIVANKADGFTLYGIRLVNSPNYHVSVGGTNGFTAWDVHLQTPVDKKLIGTANDARNTDGIDPGTSQNITVAHSWIDNGDDNIAIKQGVSHMSVLDNHFYSGHGMSIGSETVLGQSFLLVDGLTEDHTTSGVRIKSNVKRGGPVHDLVYRNLCMREVPIPVAVSPYYTNQTVEPFEDPGYEGDKIPDYKGILLQNVYSEAPGDVLIAGLNAAHRTGITLDNVVVRGISPQQVHLAFADITVRGGGANFPLQGKEVKTFGEVKLLEAPKSDPCEGKFLPMR